MYKTAITPDYDLLDQYSTLATRLPKLVQTRYRRLAVVVRARVLARLRIKPGAPVKARDGMTRWKSRKQMRAFFASDGFGGGIPTIRTDEYINAFDITLDTRNFEGFITVTNSNPAAIYIGGEEQQPFHEDTGWQRYDQVIAAERPAVIGMLAEDFKLLADPKVLFE